MSDPSTIAATDKTPPSMGGFTAPSVKDLQQLLPQYEILDQIGAGGMGAVYKARQPGLDRIVAIKILPTGLDDKYEFKERFKREARAMARLHHPGIITVFEFGETESSTEEPLLYIVMEYVEGADLNYLIKTATLDVNQILAVVTQICEALQYAHEQNIVHRDIKPANIMLNLDGNVKIADFGLAKIVSTDTTVEPSLTGTHIVMGTIDYLAPEQMVSGSPVDQRADLYAIGVLIYEMLTGKAPRGAFDLPSKKVAGLDPRLDHLILRSMATDPNDRFQDANELSTAILDIGAPAPSTTSAPEAAPQASPPDQSLPWASTTAKPVAVPDELKPATQADIQAAVIEAARAATEAAQTAAQTSVNQREPSTFWPDLYAAAKTVLTMGVVLLIIVVLGLITFFSWPRISRMITQTTTSTATSTPPPTTSTTPTSASSAQWPEKQTPPSSTSTKTTPSNTLPPPPPGFPPHRGGTRPPPRKR